MMGRQTLPPLVIMINMSGGSRPTDPLGTRARVGVLLSARVGVRSSLLNLAGSQP